jgi:hypothetical protein
VSVGFHQIGFVVDDLDAAIAHWLQNVGVAPIFVYREFELAEYFFDGEPYKQVLSVAYGQAGPVQIELIHQHDDSPSAYRDFASGVVHHVAIWTPDYDTTLASYRSRGYVPVQWGNATGHAGQRFTYLGANSLGPMLEITEVLEPKAEVNRKIAAASDAYDGRNPIRDGTELALAVAASELQS